MMSNNYDVVLFTDAPSADWFARGYGAYRIASELRDHGYSVLTVDFSSTIDYATFCKIIDKAVGETTLMVGFSSTWFPYRHTKLPNRRYIVGFKSLTMNNCLDFDPDYHEWYYNSMSYRISGGELYRYASYIKSVNSKTKVIMGGAKSFEYIKETCLDHVFIGYSENQMIDYLHSLSKKGPKRIFNKIIDYDVKAQNGPFDFNASQTKYVETDCLFPTEVLTFEFSRGCIFNCTFCSYPHRNQNTKNFVKYQEVIREELLTNYTKWGVYKYYITDDTFNDYTEKLELIAEVIKTLPFKPEFWAYVRQDLIAAHPKQAELLKEIGITETYYGIETWHTPTSKAIGKGNNLERKIKGMRISKECWGDSVYVTTGIIVGLPLDTVKSIEDSVKWYQDEGYKYVDLFGYWAYALRDYEDLKQYMFTSDIEKDVKKWGYTLPDSENDPLGWTRNDAGDIYNKAQANELMNKSNAAVEPYWNKRRVWSWRSIFKSHQINWKLSLPEAVYEFSTKHYLPKLLEKLDKS